MKIAVVGPSPVPYTIGGMEYLLWGLYEHINKDTKHIAELIKVPTDEQGFWPVIESYKRFYNLNLDHFDMVITTKYPAWMVRHKNHVCYMAHRLRGLYDTYHLTRLPLKVDTSHPLVRKIMQYMDDKRSTIDGMFDLLDELYANRSKVPKKYFDFPGPFIRAIIHFLDDRAMKESTSRFFAISKTVKDRKEYFPDGADVDVVYPPSFLTDFKQGSYDYLFTVSRLDNAKRVALMIQAMKYVKGDIKFKIAGTGPMEAELKAMAEGDKRIEFLGFVNDDKVIDYYANSKAVLFLPYEEDYGLVTIEAMKSHKPVITCKDSGGPTEFVKHGINGFIADPQPKALAAQINALLNLPPEKVREMGEKAYNEVKDITWLSVMEGLLNQQENSGKKQDLIQSKPLIRKTNNRKKITVASTFHIYPPQGGGQVRLYNIYKWLAKRYDVEIVTFTNDDQKPFCGEIAENLVEIRIPRSRLHTEKEWDMQRKVGLPITDAAMPLLSQYTREYGEALKQSLRDADVAVAAHPYLVNEIFQYKGNIPFVYEAVDVEYHTKSQAYPKNRAAQELLKTVHKVEELSCKSSDFVVACSDEDRERLCSIYGIQMEKTLAVPNGVDCSNTEFVTVSERMLNKRRAKVQGEKLVLFMGSWHPPNLKACELIFEFADKTPDVKYLIMGSQSRAFRDKKLPPNVGLVGTVDENAKTKILGLVDIALNPMVSGSGTNLKMFDYMAAGIPVITTEFGARGIEDREHIHVADIAEFPEAIQSILDSDLHVKVDKVEKARKYVEENFDWSILADKYARKLEEIL